MEIGIKLSATFKNNIFYQARLNKGYDNFREFVKEYNITYGEISYNSMLSYENMKIKPNIETQKNLSKFLDVPIDILFPTEIGITAKKLKKVNKKLYLITEAEKLISGQREEIPMFIEELKENINRAMNELDPREKKVLELRFYEGKTLLEVGNVFNIQPERIRQIEGKALRKLRHPLRAKILKEGD